MPIRSSQPSDATVVQDLALECPVLKLPPQERVILLNDDYTPMPFVVQILEEIFNHSPSRAQALMLQIHHEGRACCGVFPPEVARTRAERTMLVADHHGFPLMCLVEPEASSEDAS